MVILQGKAVGGGITIGPLHLLKQSALAVERSLVEDTAAEVERFQVARQAAISLLGELHTKAVAEVGEDNAAILKVHQMMLEDLDYIEAIEGLIREQSVIAEYAVQTTASNFAAIFAAMDDDYMRARAADVQDVSQKVLACLQEKKQEAATCEEKYILLADDLAPSETVQLDKSKVLGFVTAAGSVNSHTAILARTMGIPAVVNTGVFAWEAFEGKLGAVDGVNGLVYLEPDAVTLARLEAELAKQQEHKELLQRLKGLPSVTSKGQRVQVCANIGNTGDLAAVLANDAEGIGLFRSEFLYLESEGFPSEEEQFAKYKLAAETMAGKQVVIRTLDIGADKKVGYFNLPEEDNPALGYRAIRICLKQPDIFQTQLRAICRASAFGKLAVMFPMIISVQEVRQARDILLQVQQELRFAGIAFDESMQVGIMIETPAAALLSEELAQEVDFFSIGTNDLSQYTLAIDRQNQKLQSFFDPHHPAIMRLIEMTVAAAHKAGIWCGVCGELGADLTLTERFVEMGMDELSVSPPKVLPLREAIRNL
ncbi:MAG: phosphoenolpyruvate--protein phosphotransferase [Phascolarctobacterium sp.]